MLIFNLKKELFEKIVDKSRIRNKSLQECIEERK